MPQFFKIWVGLGFFFFLNEFIDVSNKACRFYYVLLKSCSSAPYNMKDIIKISEIVEEIHRISLNHKFSILEALWQSILVIDKCQYFKLMKALAHLPYLENSI